MCCFPSIPHPAKLKLFFERVVWLISCHSDSALSYIFISSFHSCVNQMISLISTMVPPGHLSWHSSHWACRPSHQWGDWGWSKWENGHLWYFLWYQWSMIKNDFWFDFFYKSNIMIVDENLQYSVAKRGSVAGLPYQPATNDLLCFLFLTKWSFICQAAGLH